jgi:polar amino acid transport system substrate-binding protein/cystine transport system substrate-binding protein/membrane-bound lytic murein transglycosylase F
MDRLWRRARGFGGLALVVALMVAVTFLPPDTSLDEVRASGSLRACVPTAYPPLVTGDPDRPGIDIEILQAVADHIGVSLLHSPNDAIGRDFNPRNWDVNRARCQVLAGGVVDTVLTRSFLDTSPPHAETGWSLVSTGPTDDISGTELGALTLVSGLDRIGLSGYLRGRGVAVRVLRDETAFVDAIASGAVDGGITESLLAGWLAAENGWHAAPLADGLARPGLVLGLWKGDITLKREIVAALHRIEADGTLEAILARYGAAPPAEETPVPAF